MRQIDSRFIISFLIKLTLFCLEGILVAVLTQIGDTFLLGIFLVCDLLNVCRNISDGVSPFIPPCSLLSLYALTNISYLVFLDYAWYMLYWNEFVLDYLVICLYFSLQLGIGIWNRLIFHVVMSKKVFKDFGCKLFTIVMHVFLGLSINHNLLFKYI
jgi:hypothetical protein